MMACLCTGRCRQWPYTCSGAPRLPEPARLVLAQFDVEADLVMQRAIGATLFPPKPRIRAKAGREVVRAG